MFKNIFKSLILIKLSHSSSKKDLILKCNYDLDLSEKTIIDNFLKNRINIVRFNCKVFKYIKYPKKQYMNKFIYVNLRGLSFNVEVQWEIQNLINLRIIPFYNSKCLQNT